DVVDDGRRVAGGHPADRLPFGIAVEDRGIAADLVPGGELLVLLAPVAVDENAGHLDRRFDDLRVAERTCAQSLARPSAVAGEEEEDRLALVPGVEHRALRIAALSLPV